jgi:hypothetical protein
MAEYTLHEIRVSFDAPPLKALKPDSLTIEKKKEFEANFQWVKYAILFTNKKMKWFSYITPLYPWGERQKGGQEIYSSDSIGNIDEKEEVDIPTESVEKEFEKYLKGPELFPKAQVAYVNANKTDRHKYSSEEFKRDFVDSGRYVLLTKNRRYVDPLGNLLGKQGQPKEEKTARKAVLLAKEKEYFSGGFDIMKKLFKKQHQDQKKKKH